MEVSAVLASAEERVVEEAVASLAQLDQIHLRASTTDERRRHVRQLFGLMLRCIHEGHAGSIIKPSEQIAAHCFASGTGLEQVQVEFSVLGQVLWRHLDGSFSGGQLVQALELVHATV